MMDDPEMKGADYTIICVDSTARGNGDKVGVGPKILHILRENMNHFVPLHPIWSWAKYPSHIEDRANQIWVHYFSSCTSFVCASDSHFFIHLSMFPLPQRCGFDQNARNAAIHIPPLCAMCTNWPAHGPGDYIQPAECQRKNIGGAIVIRHKALLRIAP